MKVEWFDNLSAETLQIIVNDELISEHDYTEEELELNSIVKFPQMNLHDVAKVSFKMKGAAFEDDGPKLGISEIKIFAQDKRYTDNSDTAASMR